MLMPQIASAAALRPNERLVQVWRAGLETTIMDPEDGPSNTNLSGVLLATDQRLIFMQKKNILSSKYSITENLEYGNIASWKVRHLLRVKNLQIDLFQGRDRQKVFNNLCEVDPGTLSALQPWTAENLHSLLQGLIAVRR